MIAPASDAGGTRPADVRDAAIGARRIGRDEPPALLFPALRTRLLERLGAGEGERKKCLCLVAPVGYGKTVLMSQWLQDLRGRGRRCLWVTLDDRDHGIESLVVDIAQRLPGRDPELPPPVSLFPLRVPLEQQVDEVVARLGALWSPLTLFIDNLQHCTDPLLTRLLDGLLFRTGAGIQLVCSSTQEPPLDMARARLSGLVELAGPGQLGFDRDEVAGLLGQELRDALGEPGVDELTRQTEGWPAAARLAQIVLAGSNAPRTALAEFSGSDEALAQLLNRRVLSGFPEGMRTFALCLAQLRTFSGDLCAAVMPAMQAREHLAALIERNVFVIPLDRNRHWYRLHGLFREFLLREAESSLAAELRHAVLSSASRWCGERGDWSEAVEYALAAGSHALAGRLLERVATDLVRDGGDVPAYMTWMEALHARQALAPAEAEYWFVWALTFQRRFEYARRHAAALAARLRRRQRVAPSASPARLERRIEILRMSIDSLTDRGPDACAQAEQWLAGQAEGDEPFNLAAASCIVTCHRTNRLEFAAARAAVRRAREAAHQAASAHVDGWVAAYASLPELAAGNLSEAHASLLVALDDASARLGEHAEIAGTLALLAARAAVVMGCDDEARRLLERGLRGSRTHGFLEAAGAGLEAAVLLWNGQDDGPVTLSALRDIATSYPRRLGLMLLYWLARRLIRLGRHEDARIALDDAAAEAASGGPAAQRPGLVEQLEPAARIELLLATGRDGQALPLIGVEMERARATACIARQVELDLDWATVAMRAEDLATAVRHVTRAVRLAAPRRIARPFQDHAATVGGVVARARVSAWGFAADEERRFLAQVSRGLPVVDANARQRFSDVHDQPRLLAPLTARESALLRLIDAGLSNQQMADRDEVSVTTVKWHLQNLYAKLGVSSRAAALARARALDLLAR